jgi:hypothetical protein
LVVLNATLVAPVKPEPVIVTDVPTEPLVGLKPVIAGSTLNAVDEVAVPPDVATLTGPLVAPAGTLVLI